jgi:hypothetical protein
VAAQPIRFPQPLAILAIPVAALLGITLDRMLELRTVAARLAWTVAAMLYLPAMLDLGRPRAFRYLLGSFTTERGLPDDFVTGPLFAGTLFALALVLLVSIFVRSWSLVAAFAVAATLLAGNNAWRAIPELTPTHSMKELAEAWSAAEPGTDELGFYGEARPTAAFYAAGRLTPLERSRDFFEFMAPGEPAYSIVEQSLLVEIDTAYRKIHDGSRLHLVDRSHDSYVLISNRKP